MHMPFFPILLTNLRKCLEKIYIFCFKADPDKIFEKRCCHIGHRIFHPRKCHPRKFHPRIFHPPPCPFHHSVYFTTLSISPLCQIKKNCKISETSDTQWESPFKTFITGMWTFETDNCLKWAFTWQQSCKISWFFPK
jgi:hypothetical protein